MTGGVKRSGVLAGAVLALLFSGIPMPSLARSVATPRTAGPIVSARANEPVILTGAQLPGWSRSPATGAAKAYPSGTPSPTGDDVRSAHNGLLTVPPDARTGVDPERVAAYAWTGASWVEIPVQVDRKYQYFLANARSSFSIYSGTDQELTFDWSPTGHSTGEEAWKKVFGDCYARYANTPAEAAAAVKGATPSGWIVPPTSPASPDDYTQAMKDPLWQQLTDVDEVVFMAGDAGAMVTTTTPPPSGTDPGSGQAVTIIDPTAATGPGFVYLFTQAGGSSFNASNGYVQMTWDTGALPDGSGGPANEWIDRASFAPTDPNKTSVSNESYGPHVPGNVCRTNAANDQGISTPNGTARPAYKGRRTPRDGMTITTPTYLIYASGRWMVREYRITTPGSSYSYGPNLVSRWKGRAFQQSPDSNVSIVGFEDEQVNWEANGTLLGWKVGPVRAIREVWGADSGTNVTKTEIFYRDADVFHYHVRVHPIPPDGLYTSWDYRIGAIDTYYNQVKTAGVPVDGVNDTVGHVDTIPVPGMPQPAYFDFCDPSANICSAIDNPEEWAGSHGGMVYVAELLGVTSAAHPAVVPYYRDDACLDDGTGDGNTHPGGVGGNGPVSGPPYRPLPGDNSTDAAVQAAYVAYWKAHGAPSTLVYSDLKCNDPTNAALPMWQRYPFASTIGQGGLHFFLTSDSDNTFSPGTTDEIDAQQWRYAVPMSRATNVIGAYGNNVVLKLQTLVAPYGQTPAAGTAPEVPLVALLPAAGGVGLVLARWRRRTRAA